MEQQSVVSATRNLQDLIGRRSAINERIVSEIQRAGTQIQSLKEGLGSVEAQHRQVLVLDDQIRRKEEQRDREVSGCISLLALTNRDLQRSFGISICDDGYDWLALPDGVFPAPVGDFLSGNCIRYFSPTGAHLKHEIWELLDEYGISDDVKASPLGYILLRVAHEVNTVQGSKTGMINLAHKTDLLHTFAQHNLTRAGRVDYTLWYREPGLARIHLVVVEADFAKDDEQAETRAIASMLMVQGSRWQACDMLAVVYGLVHNEDHYSFTFLRLDATRKVQRVTACWESFRPTQDSRITSILWNIFGEARMYDDSAVDPDYEDSFRDPNSEGSSTCTGGDEEDLPLSDC
ncbi:hypothetical protein BO99DRAFT_436102 [Aspergillus violaceofuscus CBS 115571]|uniref:Uncharacterized protein n=1 Tax=Aspergillus violaceofuscus (strain CBS 115571) TaxID=1450538 RepID=A0A2V5HIB5_ASPV1|nr:hypothetical protein BO99DRAFT_436102 [Aspergillus violaceofuscus CBS 115571]